MLDFAVTIIIASIYGLTISLLFLTFPYILARKLRFNKLDQAGIMFDFSFNSLFPKKTRLLDKLLKNKS